MNMDWSGLETTLAKILSSTDTDFNKVGLAK